MVIYSSIIGSRRLIHAKNALISSLVLGDIVFSPVHGNNFSVVYDNLNTSFHYISVYVIISPYFLFNLQRI